MTITGEKIYSKAATRKALKISRARYEQFIESGILAKPFAVVEGSRPIHTESQIRLAESTLYDRACRAHLEAEQRNRELGYKPMKPVSDALIASRRNYLERKYK